MEKTQKIMDLTKELGTLIKDTNEFKRMMLAQMAQEMDIPLQKQMKEFGELREKLIAAMAADKSEDPVAKKMDEELNVLFGQIKENEKMKELEDASKHFDTLMQTVYEVLNKEITGQEMGSSCGSDCSSCHGCG